MTTALVVLSAIMAIIVGWLWRRTVNVAPWTAQRAGDAAPGNGELQMPSVQVGLVVFMTVATSLFALLISAYYMRMVETDWTNFALPRVLWINSGVLVLASAAMHMTRTAARHGNLDATRTALIASGAFSFAFLGGQVWAWQQLRASGELAPANPAYAFFILLTAVHGLHLIGGMWVLVRATYRAMRGVDPKRVRLSVELCTLYWHYLLLVWAALFFVLLNTHR